MESCGDILPSNAASEILNELAYPSLRAVGDFQTVREQVRASNRNNQTGRGTQTMTPPSIVRVRESVAKSSFLRFLISGGVNTGATYAVYLGMLQITEYKTAYTIAYIFGVVLAFSINLLFVFQTHRGWRSVVLFPFVYVVQYLTSLGLIWLWVERLRLPKELAPLIAIVVTIPLTFLLSRLVFGGKKRATSLPVSRPD